MSSDLDPLLKRLHLANARRAWRDLVRRAETEQWSYEQLLQTLFAEEVAHRRGTRLGRAVRAAQLPFLRTVEEFDFAYQSTLRLTTVGSLLMARSIRPSGRRGHRVERAPPRALTVLGDGMVKRRASITAPWRRGAPRRPVGPAGDQDGDTARRPPGGAHAALTGVPPSETQMSRRIARGFVSDRRLRRGSS